MKAYSIDFREKVVKAYARGDTSIRKLAAKFDVSKAFVQRVVKQNGFFGGQVSSQKKPQQLTGHVQPKKQGGAMKSELEEYSMELAQMVENYPDATLSVSCEYWGETYSSWYSTSTMCRALQKLTRKKRRYTQAATERVLKLRGEYWQQVKNIEPHNLVFLDETGVMLGLTRTYARSPRGMRSV